MICAFGRLGTWFGIERWPEVRPDMITFAKGVTSGYLPLGGVIVDGAVAAPFFAGPGSPMLRHGATYAGHPTCAAAALAVLDAYESEDLIGRGRELEGPLPDALAPLADHDAVGEVRAGTGLLGAVALSEDALAADPGAVAKVAAGARAAGVLVRPLLRGVALSPPLIVDESHLAEAADGDPGGARAALAAPPHVNGARARKARRSAVRRCPARADPPLVAAVDVRRAHIRPPPNRRRATLRAWKPISPPSPP